MIGSHQRVGRVPQQQSIYNQVIQLTVSFFPSPVSKLAAGRSTQGIL